MARTKNVGGRNRFLRLLMGVGFLTLARRANRRNSRMLSEFATLAGTSLLFNAATGYCGFNRLLGRDSTAGGPQTELSGAEATQQLGEETVVSGDSTD